MSHICGKRALEFSLFHVLLSFLGIEQGYILQTPLQLTEAGV